MRITTNTDMAETGRRGGGGRDEVRVRGRHRARRRARGGAISDDHAGGDARPRRGVLLRAGGARPARGARRRELRSDRSRPAFDDVRLGHDHAQARMAPRRARRAAAARARIPRRLRHRRERRGARRAPLGCGTGRELRGLRDRRQRHRRRRADERPAGARARPPGDGASAIASRSARAIRSRACVRITATAGRGWPRGPRSRRAGVRHRTRCPTRTRPGSSKRTTSRWASPTWFSCSRPNASCSAAAS